MRKTNELVELLQQFERRGDLDHVHVAWLELARKYGAENVQLGAVVTRCRYRRGDERKRRRRIVSEHTQPLEELESPYTVEEEILREERRAVVLAEVAGLPANMAAVVKRCLLDGQSIAQVALELKRPEGTVKSWPFRGKELLRANRRLASVAA